MLPTLGIDLGKASFHVELSVNDKQRHRRFNNTREGFAELAAWLAKQQAGMVHACMEATGIYGDALAHYLFTQGHTVSVVNPALIKAFGQSELLRNKDDRPDAALIRRFCEKQQPRAWAPPPAYVRELRALSRHLDDLKATRQQLLNRQEGTRNKTVLKSLHKLVKQLEVEIERIQQQIEAHIDQHPDLKQMRDRLVTIPGIGEVSATAILSELEQIQQFTSARELAAYAGLTPRNQRSGTWRGRTRLSKMGNARLRKVLFMPALTAMRSNTIIRSFCLRLAQRGKAKMAIVGAAMRKLIHMVFGVIRNGADFDPNIETTRNAAA